MWFCSNKAGNLKVSFWRGYAFDLLFYYFVFSFNSLTRFSCLCSALSNWPLNSLFGLAWGIYENEQFQFEGHTSLFSEESTPERDALILEGDQCILRTVLPTTTFEGSNRDVLHKSVFMVGDGTPDTNQQLLAGKTSGSSR